MAYMHQDGDEEVEAITKLLVFVVFALAATYSRIRLTGLALNMLGKSHDRYFCNTGRCLGLPRILNVEKPISFRFIERHSNLLWGC